MIENETREATSFGKEDSEPTKNVACLMSPLRSWFEAMTAILEPLHKTPVSKL
jgi:hypothetical protein